MSTHEITEEAARIIALAFAQAQASMAWDTYSDETRALLVDSALPTARHSLRSALPHLRVQETPDALIVKAEALEEEAKRMEDFGHPHEWSDRLRHRAQYWRAQADECPALQSRPVIEREAVAKAIHDAVWPNCPNEHVMYADGTEGEAVDAVLALLPTTEAI